MEAVQDDSNCKNWTGSPLEELYNGQGPWSFSVPAIQPSKSHSVLFELPASLKEPPKPHYFSKPKHWDDDHVRMPYASESLFLVEEDGESSIKPRWDIICESLSKPINSLEDLENAINSYNNKLPKFVALQHFFTEVLEEEETQQFFEHLLPKIIKLALSLPEIIPGHIPLLKKSHSKAISFSQLQVASILANAFLCTFVWRKEKCGSYPGVNFVRLFMANQRITRLESVTEKIKCILHYFQRVTTNSPKGVLTFERKHISRNQMPRWDVVDNVIGATKIHITNLEKIEDASGLLQVDFANKFVGGGVLSYGCVQEEIRFVICPELIVSRLFTEELGDGEAVIVIGAERYSNYTGYADSFKWDGSVVDNTPFDGYGRRRTQITMIDATRFTRPKDQFHASSILRELNKAYVGFSANDKHNLSPVATGNWGCGAFRGDPKLKSLIQLMACSAAGRALVYHTFNNSDTMESFHQMYLFLSSNNITINQLWRYLCRFCSGNVQPDKLYPFIQQCHFDLKAQPSLKQFLCFNAQKRKTNPMPSTSGGLTEVKKKNSPNTTSAQIDTGEDADNYVETVKVEEPSVSSVESSKKVAVNSQEIIDIINILDDNYNNKKEEITVEETSLLVEAGKLTVPSKAQGIEEVKNESTEISMELEEEANPRPLSFMEDKKRKITDYFCKMTGF